MPTTLDLRQNDRADMHSNRAVPVIDAAGLRACPDAPEISAALDSAARSTGFLYLENVFAGTVASGELQAQMRRFFALPDGDPRKEAINIAERQIKYGWMPMYGEPAYQPGTVAHVESFDCGRPTRPGDESARISVWPDLPGFHDAARAVWTGLTATGKSLLEAIAGSAGLEADFLASRCASQDLSTMRLLHYPGKPAPASGRDVGIAAHTDFECVTLLYQTAPGLELLDTANRWRDAPAGPDQVIVLFGDMLERFSNGRYRATGHRVRQTERERYSVVLFFAVDDGVVVEPVPPFTGPGNPSRYPPLTQREHSAREIARSERNRDQERSA